MAQSHYWGTVAPHQHQNRFYGDVTASQSSGPAESGGGKVLRVQQTGPIMAEVQTALLKVKEKLKTKIKCFCI